MIARIVTSNFNFYILDTCRESGVDRAVANREYIYSSDSGRYFVGYGDLLVLPLLLLPSLPHIYPASLALGKYGKPSHSRRDLCQKVSGTLPAHIPLSRYNLPRIPPLGPSKLFAKAQIYILTRAIKSIRANVCFRSIIDP